MDEPFLKPAASLLSPSALNSDSFAAFTAISPRLVFAQQLGR